MYKIALDIALVAATSMYAQWLAEHKEPEPDLVWLEVVAGTALCLAHAGVRSRIKGSDWRSHEIETWRSFALGGAPIIVGELAQAWRRRQKRQELADKWGG